MGSMARRLIGRQVRSARRSPGEQHDPATEWPRARAVHPAVAFQRRFPCLRYPTLAIRP
jgi:hypothetical protein